MALTTFCYVSLSLSILFSSISASPLLEPRATTPISQITPSQWAALNSSVGGRLARGAPLAEPCYSFYNGSVVAPDVAQCAAVQNGYTNEQFIADNYGGYQNVSTKSHRIATNQDS